ncbi:phosphonate ABC transporter, permease protein PhnE [Chthonobacter albigriseus]|uniref:phosphonate ABC transporter, permease protein PhnE n=1 Tax=Chthonobacter albigriseus TaxID=1683161 RepID=UPI0015EFC28F|nr:phosphonate ABC transporter, permease protein PhnE [Chthonobacter albigriseus]
MTPSTLRTGLPARFERPPVSRAVLLVAAMAFLAWAFAGSGLDAGKLARGIPAVGSILDRMIPPSLERLDSILLSLLVTFQMAVAGCVLGLVLSLPLAVLAADGLSPHPLVRVAARGLIALFRTVPDLVWALLFVIAVGLGPAAGVLAIMVDTIGFAARFFAEAMEETDKGPREALTALGARRLGLIASAVVPDAMPAFVATSLFCLEKATRASVVLGLVGAGGIGVELKVAFDLFDYDTASTIILVVFALVVLVEQAGAFLRRRLI